MHDEPQTAMLLTEQEWNDLEYMVTHYRDETQWIRFAREDELLVKVIRRRHELAGRIIDANT